MARKIDKELKKTKKRTTTRRITFYRALVGYHEDGRPKTFDPLPYLHAIAAIAWEASNARYLTVEDGAALAMWDEDGFETRPRGRFGIVRRDALPAVEYLGALTDLDLRPEEGLVEHIHIRFFPNNIVAADFNFYGPRVQKLTQYLAAIVPNAGPAVEFAPLYRKSGVDALYGLRDLHSFNLQVHRSFLQQMYSAPDEVQRGLEAVAKIG